MATATVSRGTPPTEAEVREALRLRAELYPGDDPRKILANAVDAFGQFMHSPAWDVLESPDPRSADNLGDPGADDIWTSDLRPSEARDLMTAFEGGRGEAMAAAEAAIVDAFVVAALRFAERHPGAPRP